MKSSRPELILENKFISINDIHAIILHSIILPLAFSVAFDKLSHFINNNIISAPIIILFLMSTLFITYNYPNKLGRQNKSQKITTRFSQRLFEKKQKTGIL